MTLRGGSGQTTDGGCGLQHLCLALRADLNVAVQMVLVWSNGSLQIFSFKIIFSWNER